MNSKKYNNVMKVNMNPTSFLLVIIFFLILSIIPINSF